MPTVEELKSELKKKGVKVPSGARKADLIKLLESFPEGEVAPVPTPTPTPTPAAAATPKSKTSTGKSPLRILDFFNGPRLLVSVEFDDNEANLDKKCAGHPLECTNYAFEYSSGTSNVYNFKNIFLPILRNEADGWLNKDTGADNNLTSILIRNFQSILSPRKLTEKCVNEMKEFLKEFISRFGCWRQLQISVCLAREGDLWFETLFFKTLRELLLNFNYCSYKPLRMLEKELAEIEKSQVMPIIKDTKIKVLKQKIKEINDLNLERAIDNAFENKLNDIVQESSPYGFLYKRKTPLTSLAYDLPRFERDSRVTPKMVNDWLLSNKSLCILEDDADRIRKKKLREAEDELKKVDAAIEELKKKRIDPSKVDIETYFGWLRCE